VHVKGGSWSKHIDDLINAPLSWAVTFATLQVCLISNNADYEPRGGLRILLLGLAGRKWDEIVLEKRCRLYFSFLIAFCFPPSDPTPSFLTMCFYNTFEHCKWPSRLSFTSVVVLLHHYYTLFSLHSTHFSPPSFVHSILPAFEAGRTSQSLLRVREWTLL